MKNNNLTRKRRGIKRNQLLAYEYIILKNITKEVIALRRLNKVVNNETYN